MTGIVHIRPGADAQRMADEARTMGLEAGTQGNVAVFRLPSSHKPHCNCQHCQARRAEEFDGPEPPAAA